MRVKIREDVSESILKGCMDEHNKVFEITKMFAERVGKLAGQWVEVDTDRLSRNYYHVLPIEGVSENGFAIQDSRVTEVEGDIRPYMQFCDLCLKPSEIGATCPHCGNSEHLVELINVMKTANVENGETIIAMNELALGIQKKIIYGNQSKLTTKYYKKLLKFVVGDIKGLC